MNLTDREFYQKFGPDVSGLIEASLSLESALDAHEDISEGPPIFWDEVEEKDLQTKAELGLV